MDTRLLSVIHVANDSPTPTLAVVSIDAQKLLSLMSSFQSFCL